MAATHGLKKLRVTGKEKPKALGMNNEGLFDIACISCKKKKQPVNTIGEYHCKYCGVMCEPCSAKHPKIPKKKTHWAAKIRLIEEEKIIRKPTFNYATKCELHKAKRVLGYCLNCGELVCNVCLKEEHKECQIIETVENMAVDIKREKDHLNAKSELSDVVQRTRDIVKLKNKELQKLNKQSENFDRALHQTQVKLMEMVINILENYKKEKDKFYEAEVMNIRSNISQCKNLTQIFETAVEKLDEAFHTGKPQDLWIALKKLEKLLTDCETTLAENEIESTEAKFEFKPNRDIEAFLKNPESIGKLRLTPSRQVDLDTNDTGDTKLDLSYSAMTPTGSARPRPGTNSTRFRPETSSTRPASKNNRRKKYTPSARQVSINESVHEQESDFGESISGHVSLEFTGKKEIKFDFDSTQCCVTGCVFLSNGRLVLVDYNNQRLKLFNPEYELITQKKFDDRPWDVASLQTEVIAVSFPFIKTIKIMKAGKNFAIQSEVRTEFKCHGVGYHKTEETLWVACGEGAKTQLQVYNLDGIIKKIIIPKIGILQEPSYVTMNADCSKFFVSDLKTGIVAFNTVKDCEVLFQYHDDSIQKYWGVTADPSGRVYVVTTDPDSLYALYGQFNGRLLTELESDEKPCAVAYNRTLGTLAVTRWKSETIEVYRVVADK